MMTKEQALETIEHLSNTATAAMKKDRRHAFLAVIYFDDPKEGLQPCLMDMDPLLQEADRLWDEGMREGFENAKDIMRSLLKARIKKVDAHGIAIVGEAWQKHINAKKYPILGGDDPSKGRRILPNPREFDDKTEILILSWEIKLQEGGILRGSRAWEIFRLGTVVTLGQPTDTEGVTGPEARTGNLIE